MAGIYFHIPFCKQACHYCDFHFVTSLKYKSEMLQAMQQELRTQAAADFFKGENRLQSIYFGGGTPSILEPEEIAGLLQLCAELFDTKALQEVTLEAN
ncbi:MAG TPA: coproporphyrinogen III oxidase, partial [Sphingobacteriaceae bacterium]|nr:coproporphyrinogen III oxidase [Sphingobacteriaceae bacterium]